MNRLEFLKTLGLISVGVPLLSSFGAMAQGKIIYNNFPIVTDEFEVFDEALYKIMEKDATGDVFHYYKDGTFLEMWKRRKYFVYALYPSNSFFCLYKEFYASNGYIMRKGIDYVRGFAKGLWYDFDEKGHLIKTTDYDAPFTFSFEDILAYCRAHRIEVTKGYQRIGYHNGIHRFVNKDGSCYWKISHKIALDREENIYLDGKTGREIKREENLYGVEGK